MPKGSRDKTIRNAGSKGHSTRSAKAETVASLGVRVRLVPVDADRERELARLIASYETLHAEWERLFQETITLLKAAAPQ